MKKSLFGAMFIVSTAFAYAQVGVGTNVPKATLDVTGQVTNDKIVDGIIAPRITGEQLKAKDDVYTYEQNGTIVYVTEPVLQISSKTRKINSPGYYFYFNPYDLGSDGYWEKVGASQTSLPQFFYMPSVLLPTNVTDSRIVDSSNSNFTVAQGEQIVFTVNLYNIFKEQFLKPVASSVLSSSEIQNLDCNVSPSKGLCGFVLANDKYEYYVTFMDESLFSNTSISADGVLSYQVDPNKIIRNGSFMNIVLKVK